MVKKIKIVLPIILALEVIFIVVLYFAPLMYLSLRFPTPISFGETVSCMSPMLYGFLLLDVLLVVVLLLLYSKKRILRVFSWVLILPTIICVFMALLIGFLSTTGVWCSQTDEIKDFGELDSSVEVYFGNQHLSDFMSDAKGNVMSYSYLYYPTLGASEFDIYFEVQLDDAEFAALVEQYSSNDIFIATPAKSITTDNGEIVPISGQFTVATEDTSVDQWDEMYIAYSEETNTFYFKLKGFYYT